MTHLLTLTELSFAYADIPLFDQINLNVSPGDFIGVIGPNGSGKSTLLKLLNGLLKPTQGSISLHQTDLATLRPRQIAREVAFVPQQTVVSHGFTAMEIVLMGRFPYKSIAALETDEDFHLAYKMLDATGALPFANRRFDTLSGGEQQRVILASALVQEPSILLLDEPTSALDLYYQLHIFNTLKILNTEQNLTIITSVHDLNLAHRFCKQIWMLGKDNSIVTGKPENILTPSRIESVFRVKMIAADPHWLIPENLSEELD